MWENIVLAIKTESFLSNVPTKLIFSANPVSFNSELKYYTFISILRVFNFVQYCLFLVSYRYFSILNICCVGVSEYDQPLFLRSPSSSSFLVYKFVELLEYLFIKGLFFSKNFLSIVNPHTKTYYLVRPSFTCGWSNGVSSLRFMKYVNTNNQSVKRNNLLINFLLYLHARWNYFIYEFSYYLWQNCSLCVFV